MAARPGRWELLDFEVDPVDADRAGVDQRVQHYQQVANAIRVESERLRRIATGAALKGKYADQLRSASGEVATDLNRVQERYDAVASALQEYGPALDSALSGSMQALEDAEAASSASSAADAMPQNTAADGQTLSADQQQQNDDRTRAVSDAANRLQDAKSRMRSVLTDLDGAGRAAAARIRGGFGDGLTDSGWDRFVAGFTKFLKVLVKVLEYIAIALAAIALVIPGVGELVFAAGLAIAAVTVAAEGALVGMGEGSWVDFGIAVAGLVTFGAAKVLGPAIKAAVSAMGRGASRSGAAAADAAEGSADGARSGTLSLRGGGFGSSRMDDFLGSMGAKAADARAWTRGAFSRLRGLPRRSESEGAEGERPPQIDWEPANIGNREAGQAGSPEEAVRKYTGAGYVRMNETMRMRGNNFRAFNLTEQGEQERWMRMVFRNVGDASSVNQFLRSAPSMGTTTTYRGVYGSFAEHLQQLRPGAEFTEDGFFSTSLNPKISEGQFIKPGLENTLMTVRGSSGRDISALSGIPKQAEVLFPSGTRFRVNAVGIRNGIHHLDVEEVGAAVGAVRRASQP